MAGVYLYSDWSDVDEELDRLERMPTPEMTNLLDAALAELFGLTQTVVHVQTGSLKSSGRRDSKVNRAGRTWQGEINYGGPSTGVNNPVDYASYEQARDDSHDFMRPVVVLGDGIMASAMEKGLS